VAARTWWDAGQVGQRSALYDSGVEPLFSSFSLGGSLMSVNTVTDVTENERDETHPAFHVTSGRERGYHRTAVDAFLAAARTSFENDRDGLTAADIRV